MVTVYKHVVCGCTFAALDALTLDVWQWSLQMRFTVCSAVAVGKAT